MKITRPLDATNLGPDGLQHRVRSVDVRDELAHEGVGICRSLVNSRAKHEHIQSSMLQYQRSDGVKTSCAGYIGDDRFNLTIPARRDPSQFVLAASRPEDKGSGVG